MEHRVLRGLIPEAITSVIITTKTKTEHAALQYDGASHHSRLKVNRAKDGM